jgi:hypothetical protein
MDRFLYVPSASSGSNQPRGIGQVLFQLDYNFWQIPGKIHCQIYNDVLFRINLIIIFVFRFAHAHGGGYPDVTPSPLAAFLVDGNCPGPGFDIFPGIRSKNEGQ